MPVPASSGGSGGSVVVVFSGPSVELATACRADPGNAMVSRLMKSTSASTISLLERY
jgi:hypothetical protein